MNTLGNVNVTFSKEFLPLNDIIAEGSYKQAKNRSLAD